MLTPDAVLPEQFFAEPLRGEGITGARALVLAMLEDGLRCFLEHQDPPRLDRLRRSRQAEVWIRSDDWSWPFSFNNVCSSLGLDADALREQILAFRDRRSETALAPRRPSHRVQRVRMHRVQKKRQR